MRNSKTIKEEAVARIRANEAPLLVLARQYSVSTNTLRAWLRDSDVRIRAEAAARHVATTLSQEQHATPTQRERLLMHALEYSPATIIITDTDGKIVYANPKLTETTGYTVEEVIGQTPRVLKSGETAPAEYGRLWKTIMGGKEWRGTFHNRRKDGSLYWERASISPVYDADGRIAHFMAVKEDITDYMEAELAQSKAAAGFLAVINALPCALLIVDQFGCIMLANETTETLFARELPEGTRLNSLNLRWIDTDGNALTAADHPLARVLSGQTGSNVLRSRIGIIPPQGGVRWMEASMRAVQLPDVKEPAALLMFESAAVAAID
jgi:PAS domain S-box-containing protein